MITAVYTGEIYFTIPLFYHSLLFRWPHKMVPSCQWERTSSLGSGIPSCPCCQSRTWMPPPGWRRRTLWHKVLPKRLWGRSRQSESNWENILGWGDVASTHCLISTNFIINMRSVGLCTGGYQWADQTLGPGGGQSGAHPGFSAESTQWGPLRSPHYASICAWFGRSCRSHAAVGHALPE